MPLPARRMRSSWPRPADPRCGSRRRTGFSSGRVGLATQDAAEPEMHGRGVDSLTLAGRRTVAQAVVGGAEVRAALDHAARDVRSWLAGHQAVLRGSDPRVPGCAARAMSEPGGE